MLLFFHHSSHCLGCTHLWDLWVMQLLFFYISILGLFWNSMLSVLIMSWSLLVGAVSTTTLVNTTYLSQRLRLTDPAGPFLFFSFCPCFFFSSVFLCLSGLMACSQVSHWGAGWLVDDIISLVITAGPLKPIKASKPHFSFSPFNNFIHGCKTRAALTDAQ